MMIKRLVFIAALAGLTQAAVAGPAADALGQCLSDNTSGRERKELAKWIFVAMAAHPEIQTVAKVGPVMVEETQRAAGTIFTRLLGSACTKESQAAVQAEGPNGARLAFEFLGRIAMQELMSNPDVAATITGFERYVDRPAVERAFRAP